MNTNEPGSSSEETKQDKENVEAINKDLEKEFDKSESEEKDVIEKEPKKKPVVEKAAVIPFHQQVQNTYRELAKKAAVVEAPIEKVKTPSKKKKDA